MDNDDHQYDFIETLTHQQNADVMDAFTLEITAVLKNLNISEGHSVALASILLKHSLGLYRGFLSDDEIQIILEFAAGSLVQIEPNFSEEYKNRTLN